MKADFEGRNYDINIAWLAGWLIKSRLNYKVLIIVTLNDISINEHTILWIRRVCKFSEKEVLQLTRQMEMEELQKPQKRPFTFP